MNDVKDILELVKIKIERNEDFFTRTSKLPAPTGGVGNPIIGAGNPGKFGQKGFDY